MGATSDMQGQDPFAALAARANDASISGAPRGAPPSSLLDVVEADLRTDGASPRPMTRAMRLIASAALLLVGLLSTSLKAWARHPGLLVFGGIIFALFLGALVLGRFIPGGSTRLRLEVRRAALTLLLVTLAVLLLVQQSEIVPPGEFLGPAHLSPALSCSMHCLWTGGLCLVGLLFTWQRTDPFSPRLTGALMGVCSGLIANWGVGLGCASVEALHLLFGHGASVLLLGVAGWLAGRRVLSP